MYTKEQIISKLDQFKAYSIANGKYSASDYTSKMQDLYTAVNSFYSRDRSNLKSELEKVVLYAHNDIWARNAKFENNFNMNFRYDYPDGYWDFGELFTDDFFTSIFNTTNEEFLNAWKEKQIGFDSSTYTEIYALDYNSLVNDWVKAIPTDDSAVLEKIKNLADWYDKDLQGSSMVSLWEDQGNILSKKETQEIAQIIYINRKLKEVNDAFNIGLYIPTYLK